MQPVPVVAVLHSASNMDFQFTHYLGNVHAKCSMEHIALANWFNSEVRSNPQAFLSLHCSAGLTGSKSVLQRENEFY